ncbi:long-chain fatty acid--CoA ligase [Kineobactrum sediminis]|uniref:Long-chain fatty acid--CoA ligase n=1 Tax=Kineobactrum sediminis TaxID=1905677 RepID=A0A2N5Y6E3_9GAMM|nr:class I adenylate-forming enzyme family protein [Kineobactrum sediminis]PLW83939.1 long-chain fatty acid--CoA ligase [Kineobactrum sediminis]
MHPEIEKIEAAVAALTAPGQPFALNEMEIDGVRFRNYVAMPANLGEYCALLQQHGDKPFIVYRDQRYSFAETWQRSAALAAALQQRFGVEPGDRVAIVSRNNPEWMMAFIAIVAIGGIAVPMNAWWTTEELDYGIGDSGSRVVVADPERVARLASIAAQHDLQIIAVGDCTGLAVDTTDFEALQAEFAGAAMPPVTVAPDDHATIMYTSGSTGHPKGALSSHRGVLSAIWSWMLLGVATKQAGSADAPAPQYPPAGLLTIPLFHCTGSHSAFLLSMLIGRKMVIMHKWDVDEALRLIEAERITWFNGVPTMSAELQAAARDSAHDLSSLVDVFSGGAARPPDQVGKIAGTFRASVPGIGYGLTETNALGAVNSGAFYIANPHSTGRAVPAVTDFKVIDSAGNSLPAGERGELCMKSPANVLGYWNKPEATAEAFIDGWFHTGDVAYLDDDGYLYIVDRIKEIIIRGGENISCIEVEAAIYQHPAVVEAAVFGLPDERLGEKVGAVVVLAEGAALATDELQDYLREHVASFKVPAHVWLQHEQLPRIASGKIFKRQLKADYTARLAQELAG